MVEKNEHLAWDGNLEAACGKIEDGCDLFTRQIEPLHDLFNSGSRFEILEDNGNGHASAAEDQAPLTLPGMLWTAGHCDQSGAGIDTSSFRPSYTRWTYVEGTNALREGQLLAWDEPKLALAKPASAAPSKGAASLLRKKASA
jgi:hypothetical protein